MLALAASELAPGVAGDGCETVEVAGGDYRVAGSKDGYRGFQRPFDYLDSIIYLG
jgi:hypothetical protein